MGMLDKVKHYVSWHEVDVTMVKELLEKNELGDIIDIKATAFRSLGSDSGSAIVGGLG